MTLLDDTQTRRYWNEYYKGKQGPQFPSPFAAFCQQRFPNRECVILEIGCGNGRDSFYFSRRHDVYGIDASSVVVEQNNLKAKRQNFMKARFYAGDFDQVPVEGLPPFDVVYSRFALHAMPEETANLVLERAFEFLKPGGIMMLEFRTIKDPLMKQGQTVGLNERLTDHYRRFIDIQVMKRKLLSLEFSIDYFVESNGLAVHGNDDPVVGRIIARKPN